MTRHQRIDGQNERPQRPGGSRCDWLSSFHQLLPTSPWSNNKSFHVTTKEEEEEEVENLEYFERCFVLPGIHSVAFS